MRRGGSREGGQFARRVPSHLRRGGSREDGRFTWGGLFVRGGECRVISCAEGQVARRGACHGRGRLLVRGGVGLVRRVGGRLCEGVHVTWRGGLCGVGHVTRGGAGPVGGFGPCKEGHGV